MYPSIYLSMYIYGKCNQQPASLALESASMAAAMIIRTWSELS